MKLTKQTANLTKEKRFYCSLEKQLESRKNWITDGKLFLVRCYNCEPKNGMENYLPSVSSGICSWCGWSTKKAGEEWR
jgi:hypothetical protein